jgi:hypothetical protein
MAIADAGLFVWITVPQDASRPLRPSKSMRRAMFLFTLRKILVIVLVSSVLPAYAQDSLNVHRICQVTIGGGAYAIALRDTLAYVCNGADLHVFSIADPYAAEPIGLCEAVGNGNYGLVLKDTLLYLSSESGLSVIDIRDPRVPAESAHFQTPGSAYGMAIQGNYAYMGGDIEGLWAVNISDPLHPHLAGSCVVPNWIWDVCVADSFAYVTGDYGMRIVNIANPAAPFLRGRFDQGFGTGVAIRGSYAYVGFNDSGMWIVNVSNASSPTTVGSVGMPDQTIAVTLNGDYAYVCHGSGDWQRGGFRVVNISNPSAPVVTGFHSTNGTAWAAAVEGRFAYVVDTDGFSIYDCSEAIGLSTQPRRTLPPSALSISSYPNPFNSTVQIHLNLPKGGRVGLRINDIDGRLVQQLVSGVFGVGTHTFTWNGGPFSSGTYFVTLYSEDYHVTQRIILLK